MAELAAILRANGVTVDAIRTGRIVYRDKHQVIAASATRGARRGIAHEPLSTGGRLMVSSKPNGRDGSTMRGARLTAILAGGYLLAGAAWAQSERASSFEPDTSLTFHRYLEPFPRTETAEQCRDDCVRDTRCTGWTWYDSRESNPEQLRQVCIKGAGLKDRRSGDAVGRTAGVIANQ